MELQRGQQLESLQLFTIKRQPFRRLVPRPSRKAVGTLVGAVTLFLGFLAKSELTQVPVHAPSTSGGTNGASGFSKHNIVLSDEEIDVFPGSSHPGTTIVSACYGMHETFRHTLPLIADVDGVDEVVIVDWSSTPPLNLVVEELDMFKGKTNHPLLQIIRVENETEWVASRAFNLGMSAAHFENVVLCKCDQSLDKGFLQTHPLNNYEAAFFTGSDELARTDAEDDLTNVLLLRRSDFWKYGGYDERLFVPGAEHTEFVKRIEQLGHMKRIDLEYDKLRHVDHNESVDSVRHLRERMDAVIRRDVNILLVSQLPQSSSFADTERSKYDWQTKLVLRRRNNPHESHAWLRRVRYRSAFASPKARNPPNAANASQNTDAAVTEVLRKHLEQHFDVPLNMSVGLTKSVQRQLLFSLLEQSAKMQGDQRAKLLFVECLQSLESRLVTLVSAMAFAKSTQRVLVAVWKPNPKHLNATFSDLFFIPDESNIVLLDSFQGAWPSPSIQGEGEPFVVNDPAKHLFLRRAQALKPKNRRLVSRLHLKEMLSRMHLHKHVQDMLDQQLTNRIDQSFAVYLDAKMDNASQTAAFSFMREASIGGDRWLVVGELTFVKAVQEAFSQRNFPVLVTDCNTSGVECAQRKLATLFVLARCHTVYTAQSSGLAIFTEAIQLLGGRIETFDGTRAQAKHDPYYYVHARVQGSATQKHPPAQRVR